MPLSGELALPLDPEEDAVEPALPLDPEEDAVEPALPLDPEDDAVEPALPEDCEVVGLLAMGQPASSRQVESSAARPR